MSAKSIRTCFTDFLDAVKGAMSESQARRLFDEIEARAKVNRAKHLMSRADALNKSVDDLISEIDKNKQRSARQAYRNALKRATAKEHIKRFHNEGEGVDALSNGIESNIEGAKDSINNRLNTRRQRVFSFFLADMEKNGVYPEFKSKLNDTDIAKELEKRGSTGRPEIEKLANIIEKHQKQLVQALNNEGANIFEYKEYIASLRHNTTSMLSATGKSIKDLSLKSQLLMKNKGDYAAMAAEYKEIAYQRWSNNIRPRLDERTLENVLPEDEEKFFRGAYDGLVTGIHKVPYAEGGHPLTLRSGRNLANKASQERVLFFKTDGESWVGYNKDYGYGNIHDAVLAGFDQGARSLALMEKLGTTPDTQAENLLRWATERSRGKPGAEKHIKRARNGIKTYLRQYDNATGGLSGQIFNAFRSFQYVTKLGNVTLSSIPDLSNMASALAQHDIPAFEVYGTAIQNLMKGLPKGEMKDLSMMLRTYGEGTLGTIFDRFGANAGPGFFTKAIQLQDKLTLINRWDNVLRSTMGTMLSKGLTQKLPLEWEALGAAERRTLEISSIGKSEWDLIRAHRADLDTYNNIKFLTPEVADTLSTENISKYLGQKGITKSDIKVSKVREKIRDALELYFVDQTNYGKIMPDQSDIALMRGGVDPDTVPGKVWGLMTMFKSFGVASTRRTLGRFVYGNGAQNLYEAFVGGKADYKGMANYMVQTMPLNYISIAAKAIADGKVPPSLKDKSTWTSIINPLGFMYSDTLMDIFHGDKGKFGLLGPVGSTADNIIDMLKAVGDGHDIRKRAVFLARNNMPVIKTFYSRLALDHLIWNKLLNKIDPSYLQNYKNKMEQRGTHFLWSPTK